MVTEDGEASALRGIISPEHQQHPGEERPCPPYTGRATGFPTRTPVPGEMLPWTGPVHTLDISVMIFPGTFTVSWQWEHP